MTVVPIKADIVSLWNLQRAWLRLKDQETAIDGLHCRTDSGGDRLWIALSHHIGQGLSLCAMAHNVAD